MKNLQQVLIVVFVLILTFNCCLSQKLKRKPFTTHKTHKKIVLNQVKDTEISDEEIQKQWQQWKKDFQKSYASEDEEDHAFKNFSANYKLIIKFNQESQLTGRSMQLGLNQFADMSNEEFADWVDKQGAGMKGGDNVFLSVNKKHRQN